MAEPLAEHGARVFAEIARGDDGFEAGHDWIREHVGDHVYAHALLNDTEGLYNYAAALLSRLSVMERVLRQCGEAWCDFGCNVRVTIAGDHVSSIDLPIEEVVAIALADAPTPEASRG